MSLAENTYEILKDAYDYAMRNWLRLDLAKGSENEAILMHASAAFLVDQLFGKENAGALLTRLAAEDIGDQFKVEKLTEEAKRIKVSLIGDEFASGKSALRDYVLWVSEEKEEGLEAFKADAGRLALVYIDELTTLTVVEHPEVEKLRIAEILFLNMTNAFAIALKAILKRDFGKLASAPYFLDVEADFERIRAEIDD